MRDDRCRECGEYEGSSLHSKDGSSGGYEHNYESMTPMDEAIEHGRGYRGKPPTPLARY